jgi:hypothetical protein
MRDQLPKVMRDVTPCSQGTSYHRFKGIFWKTEAACPYMTTLPHAPEDNLLQPMDLVEAEIEPGTSGSVARNSDH